MDSKLVRTELEVLVPKNGATFSHQETTIHAGSLVSPDRELSLGRMEGRCWDWSLTGFFGGQILVPKKAQKEKMCFVLFFFLGGDVLWKESG